VNDPVSFKQQFWFSTKIKRYTSWRRLHFNFFRRSITFY